MLARDLYLIFSVRAIVQSIVACDGIFAKVHHTMYDPLY